MNLNKIIHAKSTRSLLTLWGLLSASCLVIFFWFLFGDKLPVFQDCGSDTRQQYLMQYSTIINHIQDGNWSFWDFNNGFGTSMLALNLFNPFLMIVYVLGSIVGIGHLPTLLLLLLIGEILLAGTFCYLFLNSFKLSESSRILAAYIYALSGYIIVWGQHYQFGAFVVYLPLLLCFIERAIQKKKFSLPASLLIGVMVSSSVYMSYMSLILAGFYLIFRLLWAEQESCAARLKQFVLHCTSYLLGIGLGMAIFLPNAIYLFRISSRLDSDASFLSRILAYFSPYSLQFYVTSIYRMFSSSFQGITDYTGYSNFYEAPVLFFSALFVILLIQFLFLIPGSSTSVKQKVLQYLAVLLAGLCLFTRIGASVFNAFAYPFSRHSFLILPLAALLLAYTLDQVRLKKRLNIPALFLSLFAICAVHLKAMQTLSDKSIQLSCLLMMVAALGLILLLLFFNYLDKKCPYRALTAILFFLTAVNVCTEGYTCYNERETLTTTDASFFGGLYNENVSAALLYLSENDASFYRVEKDYYSGSYCMDALAQGYHGISTYNSTPNRNLEEFYAAALSNFPLMAEHEYTYRQVGYHTDYASLFGIKYLLSQNPALELSGFELLKQFGDVYIYQNQNTSSFGKFFITSGDSSILSEPDLHLDLERMLLEIALTDEPDSTLATSITGAPSADIETLKSLYGLDTIPVETANIPMKNAQTIAIPLERESLDAYKRVYLSFDITVSETSDFTVNEEEPLPYHFRVKKGEKKHVQLPIPSSYDSLSLTCYGKTCNGTISNLTWYGSKESINSYQGAEIAIANPENDSLIEGTIKTENAGLLFLPMPYEDGWTAYIDDVETKIVRTDYGFISLAVGSGEHTIRLEYQLPYFYIGLIISGCSALIWLGILIYKLRNRTKKDAS